MSKKYEKLAQEIVQKIGGNENVDSLHHCQTRLRLFLK
jgi:PTS system beta-glucosides-specific IIC component